MCVTKCDLGCLSPSRISLANMRSRKQPREGIGPGKLRRMLFKRDTGSEDLDEDVLFLLRLQSLQPLNATAIAKRAPEFECSQLQ